MLAKDYQPWNPYQLYLVPPSPLEWLPQEHLAYFILEIVQTLELSDIERVIQSKDPRGQRPYSPHMMVALLLYAYCVGIFSSRKIAQATYDHVAFRVLAGDAHPHFTTVNQFRLDHHEALADRFLQVLQLCQKAGLVKLAHVSLDGSKVQANASKHKAMSYERMQKEEARLRAEIETMLARADGIDREEDKRYGKGQDAAALPEELRRRETRLECIRATRADKAENQARKLDDNNDDASPPNSGDTDDDLPRHRVGTKPDGTPVPTAQRNFTDPASRIMKNNTGYLQAYNAQTIVDAESQIIVAEALTNQAPDQQHLEPLIERAIENCDAAPDVLSADSGYFSEHNVDVCEHRGIDPYIAVGRKNGDEPSLTNTLETETSAQRTKQRMREKLQSDTGKSVYARRKAIVEPPFGHIKEARGFRRFSLRGIAKARSEWTVVCLTHNLLKLFRALRSETSISYLTPGPAIS